MLVAFLFRVSLHQITIEMMFVCRSIWTMNLHHNDEVFTSLANVVISLSAIDVLSAIVSETGMFDLHNKYILM